MLLRRPLPAVRAFAIAEIRPRLVLNPRRILLLSLVLVAALHLPGCAQNPKPFEPGIEVVPPLGCEILRERGEPC